MSSVTFDTLDYYEKLKAAGVPDGQAKAQVEVMNAQLDKVNAVVMKYDSDARKDLATKGDVQDAKTELRKEIEALRGEMKDAKFDILKWMLGLFIAQSALIVALMAYIK